MIICLPDSASLGRIGSHRSTDEAFGNLNGIPMMAVFSLAKDLQAGHAAVWWGGGQSNPEALSHHWWGSGLRRLYAVLTTHEWTFWTPHRTRLSIALCPVKDEVQVHEGCKVLHHPTLLYFPLGPSSTSLFVIWEDSPFKFFSHIPLSLSQLLASDKNELSFLFKTINFWSAFKIDSNLRFSVYISQKMHPLQWPSAFFNMYLCAYLTWWTSRVRTLFFVSDHRTWNRVEAQ